MRECSRTGTPLCFRQEKCGFSTGTGKDGLSTMTSEVDMLAKRVGRLERENRLLKVIGIGCALGLAVLLLVGADKTPRTIEAEKIILRDSRGRARVTIATPEFAGVAIDMKASDPAIWLTDEQGEDRAVLTTDGVRFGNGRQKPLVEIISDPRPGRSALRFYSDNGKISWSAP